MKEASAAPPSASSWRQLSQRLMTNNRCRGATRLSAVSVIAKRIHKHATEMLYGLELVSCSHSSPGLFLVAHGTALISQTNATREERDICSRVVCSN